MKEMTADAVVEEVKKSGLRGRGGPVSCWIEMEFIDKNLEN
jgi:NADH:ubiquinone oxidoreductase subunit F (NADH-binding)